MRPQCCSLNFELSLLFLFGLQLVLIALSALNIESSQDHPVTPLDGSPNYSKPIGQYSSVDILIPVRKSGAYTCQQTSFIGTHYYGGWFEIWYL